MMPVVCAAENSAETSPLSADLIVVGGTPGGIACAISAAREGLNVLLVNHTAHLGGFMSSGCGGWEAPYDGARSPIFDEVKQRIADYYKDIYGEGSPQYLAAIPDPKSNSHKGRPRVEPRIAELVFDRMVAAEKRIAVLKGFYVESAEREGNMLRSIVLREMHGDRTRQATAKVFADCTYEGDLAAVAKVPYRVGREGRSEYHEPHAGVIFAKPRTKKTEASEVRLNIRRLGPLEGLDILPQSTGEADSSVMAYNYRLILTKNPANRILVQKPENYDPASIGASKASILPDLPNDKIAWNGGGRLIGPQHAYPEADWATREKISQQYLNAALARLWFYQNDPAASPKERELWKDYGLAKDEFPDHGNLPYEIYVREARRLVGRYVFTENDAVVAPGIERTPVFPDSIAITDWPIDSTVCTDRKVGEIDEGKFQLVDTWRPGQVPYRCLLPQGLNNLLVPVCLSATHVGWGTIRLEPVWMQTGEAAGLAAALAVRAGTTEIDSDELSRLLAERRHMISFFNDVDLASGASWNPAVQYLGTRGFFNTYDARPAEPLDDATATAWANTAAKIAAKDPSFDATAEAVTLAGAAGKTSSGITVLSFSDRLKEALRKRGQRAESVDAAIQKLKLQPGSPLSRGDACTLVFLTLQKA